MKEGYLCTECSPDIIKCQLPPLWDWVEICISNFREQTAFPSDTVPALSDEAGGREKARFSGQRVAPNLISRLIWAAGST